MTTTATPASTPTAAAAPAAPSTRTVGRVLAIGGSGGTAAAFALIIDRIRLLENPAFLPSCSISPVLSCGSVMTSPQSEVFGFPNPLIGLVAFPVVATLGVVLLTGAALPRWMWAGLQFGALLGAGFVHWLIWQSLYVIGALCPYCMAVWVVTIAIFWFTIVRNLHAVRSRLPQRLQPFTRGVVGLHGAVLTIWLLGITALIAVRFWDYWAGLLR